MFGLDILGGGGVPGLSASATSSAQGGSIGNFNFQPNAGISPWLIAGAALVAVLILWKR